MDQKNKYRLAETAAQNELANFAATDNPGDLSAEIALTRYLIQVAVREGNTSIVKSLSDTLANLCKSHRIELQRTNELISKTTARRTLKACGEAIAEELEFSGVSDWEQLADRIIERMLRTLATARNDQIGEEIA